MKILYVTRALIAPPQAGCMQRTTNIAHQLERCGDVTLLAVSHQFDDSSVQHCKQTFSGMQCVKLKGYDHYSPLRARLTKKFHMHWPTRCGLRADRQGQEQFEQLAAAHDLIWFHTLGAALPFDVPEDKSTVMDLDDLNHCKYELSAFSQPTVRFRLSAKVQSFKWKRLEYDALKRYSAVVVCSQQDKTLLGGLESIHVIPNGFPAPARKPEPTSPDPHRLGFIGSLGYYANHDGLVWFRDHVWPLLRDQRPQATLRIVGALPPEENLVMSNGFEYLGYLQTPDEEMKTWSAMIVPILYAGGTRIKILEAFSKLCPVVSTGTGCYGIDARDRIELLIRDGAEHFAQGCLELMDDPKRGHALAEEGWKVVTQRYQWDTIGTAIRTVVPDALKRKSYDADS